MDDHRLFADAVQRTLEREGLGPADVVTSAEDARRAIIETRPDLVLIAVTPAGGDGFELGRELLELRPETKLVAMTTRRDGVLQDTAMRAGFRATVPKDTPPTQFVECIRSVLDGEMIPRIRPHAGAAADDDPFGDLTSRERDVLRLLADGLRTDAIAERLSVSANTVRSHVHSVMSKLGVRTRLEAATYAARHGLLRSPERRHQEN